MSEDAYYKDKRRKIIETRAHTAKRLRELCFEMTDSTANFVFAKHPDISGFDLYSALKDRGILVRHFSKPRISDYLRITIGTMEQMETALAAISDVLSRHDK